MTEFSETRISGSKGGVNISGVYVSHPKDTYNTTEKLGTHAKKV